jgi:prepilin-type N-terminal cleavage/methylation domain-containing protein
MQKNLCRGFTLIELFIVTTIMLILASIAYPVYTSTQERARATQDMSNLRQIGLAAQMYFNDNDGLIFSSDAAVTWMSLLKPKYIPAWKIFQSPFDKRAATEVDATAPISYGLNGNNKPLGGTSGTSIAGLAGDKVTNPSAFILFAPAQAAGATVSFSGTPAAAVTVYKAGPAAGGTHSVRKRINALFIDSHSESMPWNQSAGPRFINDTTDATDPDAKYRWDP